MGRRRKTNFSASLRMNGFSYMMYYNKLSEIALTTFEWDNVPDEIDVRFLELMLYENGHCLFFRDDLIGYLTLNFAGSNKLDVYRNPTERRVVADNGYQNTLDKSNSVIIYNNYLRNPSCIDMEYYAMRLWDLDNIIAVNANAQKTPILVQASEEQRLSVLNVYKEYDGNSPVIYGDKNLDLNCLKVMKTDAPFVADKIYNLKKEIWNEALTTLGINFNVEKKERLVTGEEEDSRGATNAMLNTRLKARLNAVKEINNMFGLDISVRKADSIPIELPGLNSTLHLTKSEVLENTDLLDGGNVDE